MLSLRERIKNKILDLLQRRCSHTNIRHDILEGELVGHTEKMEIQWCKTCGSYRTRIHKLGQGNYLSAWKRPDPLGKNDG